MKKPVYSIDYIAECFLLKLKYAPLDPHRDIGHCFMEWWWFLMANKSINEWLGNDKEGVNFENYMRILYDLFIIEIKRKGLILSDSLIREGWKEFLED